MTYCKNYCEETGISTSQLNEAQRTLYYIAENMKMDKSISKEGYRHFQMAIAVLEQESILDKIKAEIADTLYVDSLIFGELIDFKEGKISADDVIEEFNRVTRLEVLKIIDKYKAESEDKE